MNMSNEELPYLSGNETISSLPLSRYLPLFQKGMVSNWLSEHVRDHAWVLDPIGSNPLATIEAAQAGYNVFVAVNNPILSLVLEVLADAPKNEDFKSVIAELASTRRGDQRLEIHLQNLYLTECAVCGQQIYADAFLWQRDQRQPYAKIVHCPNCGESGERPVTDFDIQHLELPGSYALHYSRALSRVLLEEEEQKAVVEEALKTYLPRPLYALFTLINKAESLQLPPQRLRLLHALIISVCDEANTLWPVSGGKIRPRQLSTPPLFRENNLWQALENAIDLWTSNPTPVPTSIFPKLPVEEHGICIYKGRMKNLSGNPRIPAMEASFMLVQHPNQAFWTQSALWAGWIWGKHAVLPLKGALERRRYDWYWQSFAMQSVFSTPEVKKLPILAIMPEFSPSLLLSSLATAQSNHLLLTGWSVNFDLETILLELKLKNDTINRNEPAAWYQAFEKSILNYLRKKGEPAGYDELFTVALIGIYAAQNQNSPPAKIKIDLFGQVQSVLEKVLKNSQILKRLSTTGTTIESGKWWLVDDREASSPISERIEAEIINLLIRGKSIPRNEIDTFLFQKFRGLFTPAKEIVSAILHSYAENPTDRQDEWRLKGNESPQTRREDIQQAMNLLLEIASRLKINTQGDNPLIWLDQNGVPSHLFYITTSSIFSPFQSAQQVQTVKNKIIVFPGSRSDLISFRMREDLHFFEVYANNWHFLKFRQLNKIAEQNSLSMSLFDSLVDLDPPDAEDATQLSML